MCDVRAVQDRVNGWETDANLSQASRKLMLYAEARLRLADARHRNAVIIGPSDTPFEDGTFRLVMHFEEAYPNKPPGVKFISQMFHPNVYGTGELCLDILQNRWSPTYDVAAILTSVQSLLNDPNTSSPANVEASNLYKDNRKEYTKRVRETVEKSWED